MAKRVPDRLDERMEGRFPGTFLVQTVAGTPVPRPWRDGQELFYWKYILFMG
ncbi:MAG: hypothetical protein HQL76_12445 [Magnetococcales bacterium]|nr:hypothetical protein [Magnetococcales bacterium]